MRMTARPFQISPGGARAARTAGSTRVAEMKETSIARKLGRGRWARQRRLVHRKGRRGRDEFAGGEQAGVAALTQGDARVLAEFLGDLAVAGVDGEDAGGAVLQHAVGEAAGRGATSMPARPVRSMTSGRGLSRA